MAAAPAAPARILVFSTDGISDPGIDLAGSAHMHYPASVSMIRVPCSSGVKPAWIARALERGFDGVFIAADGTDCALLSDCTERTARVVDRAQALLRQRGLDPKRLKMAAICSVCAESFAHHMERFQAALQSMKK